MYPYVQYYRTGTYAAVLHKRVKSHCFFPISSRWSRRCMMREKRSRRRGICLPFARREMPRGITITGTGPVRISCTGTGITKTLRIYPTYCTDLYVCHTGIPPSIAHACMHVANEGRHRGRTLWKLHRRARRRGERTRVNYLIRQPTTTVTRYQVLTAAVPGRLPVDTTTSSAIAYAYQRFIIIYCDPIPDREKRKRTKARKQEDLFFGVSTRRRDATRRSAATTKILFHFTCRATRYFTLLLLPPFTTTSFYYYYSATMGRRLRKFRQRIKETRKKLMNPDIKARVFQAVEDEGGEKPKILTADIIMISGCEDKQTSADVSNVANFQLPDPAGRAGGACTSTLLNVLYKDEQAPESDLSFVEVLDQMRDNLKSHGYEQIPQLTSTKELDLSHKFDLVPDHFEGTKRAVMVGINYIGDDPGELSGCHNDVGNMKKYIMNVHGFEEENIVVLMDDGAHTEPTKNAILAAYKKVVAQSKPGDSIFLHYSGHGSKVQDDDGDEDDGYDEVLVPRDYQKSGMIRDDDLYDLLVKGLPQGVHVVSLMDCCHSGTILDLPFMFQPTGEFEQSGTPPIMQLDADFDWQKYAGPIAKKIMGILGEVLKA